MKALVTGGGGFLGLYIAEQLRARGDDVRVFCRHPYERFDELGIEWFAGDVRDANAVAKACDQIDAVFHVAAVPGIWGSWKQFHDINTVGTQNVIAGCRRQGVGKLIFTSSASVVFRGVAQENVDETEPYPSSEEFGCHYTHSKALAEQAVLDANGRDGLSTVSIRPHLIWGPRDNHLIPRLIRRAQSGRLRRVGDGSNLVSMVYVENAAASHLQAADALTPDSPVAGQAYFVNEAEPVKLWGWIDDLLQRAGLPPLRKSISLPAAGRVGAVFEGAYRLLRLSAEPPMTRFLANQLGKSHYYSTQKAERDFGYSPIVTVEEGMQRIEPELKQLAASR